jgi:1,4-dihydroxy-2-naphthoate octaprenyltransferase
MAEQKPAQSKTTMLLICFFIGSLGIHKMMMGYEDWWKRLVLTLLCLPVGIIYKWIDLIKILQGKLVMADGRDLV